MIGFALACWTIFSFGLALQSWQWRRTAIMVLWAIQAAGLWLTYGLAGYLGVI